MRSTRTRRAPLTALSLAVTLAALSACSATAPNGEPTSGAPIEEVTLTYASCCAEGGLNYGFDWIADQVEERSDGAVTFDRFYAGSLYPVSEILTALGDGRLDVGHSGSAIDPSKFPLFAMAGVPFTTYDPGAQARAFYKLWSDGGAFREEWDRNGVRPLIFSPVSTGIMGGPKAIEELAGLDGTQMRVVGYVAAAYEAAGVQAVALPTEEIYESVQRGVVDGFALWNFDSSLVSNGLIEVVPSIVDPGLGHYAGYVIGISSAKWDSLPTATQELLDEVAQEFMQSEWEELYALQQAAACDSVEEFGASLTKYSDEDVEEFKKIGLDASLEVWYSAGEQAGLSRDVMEQFREDYLAAYDEIAASSTTVDGIAACIDRLG